MVHIFNAVYWFLRETIQCIGLFFIIYFGWRTMFAVRGPYLNISLLRTLWRSASKAFHWLLKHSWKFADELADVIAKYVPAKYRPYLQFAARCLICLLVVCAVFALLRS